MERHYARDVYAMLRHALPIADAMRTHHAEAHEREMLPDMRATMP